MPSDSIGQAQNCPICGKASGLSCGACKKENYCSREHQKSHWKAHKADCFPAQIRTNSQVGRHLVATREIQQGEIILKERPLVSGPLRKDPDCFPVCLSCFKKVESDYKCSKCAWPVCNLKCENDSDHSDFECTVFQNRNPPPATFAESSVYDKIIVLRGVLAQKKNPKVWEKIQSLQSHRESRVDHRSRVLRQATIGFIRGSCGLTDVDDEIIDHVLGAVSVNAFVSDDTISSASLYRSGSYLFFYASMPAHNCTPNSSWIIQSKNSEFVLRASVPIPANSSITQLYAQPVLGNRDRRFHLKESKYFDCDCLRCLDPTELGTYFSAVKCPECSPGYLLSVRKNNMLSPGKELAKEAAEEEEEWKCDNTDCKKVQSESFVQNVIDAIENDPRLMATIEEDSLKAISVLEKIIKAHQGKTVHPNHYCIHTLDNDLLQRMSFFLSSSQLQDVNDRVVLAEKMNVVVRKCLQISDILWPGFNRHRGRLLYFLQQSIMPPLQKFLNSQQSWKNGRAKKSPMKEGQLAKFRTMFQEVLEIRSLAYVILSIEPEGREESYIAGMMAQETDDIRELKKIFKLQ